MRTQVFQSKNWSAVYAHLYFINQKKNLWRRKCVRREIFRTVEVRVEGGFSLFNPYFVCNTFNCVTVRPVRGHLTPKMNTAFLSEISCWIFFIQQCFRKKQCFLRKRQKTVLGVHLTIFQGKGASKAKN